METLYGWYSETQYKQKMRKCDSQQKRGERIFYLDENDQLVEITEIKHTDESSLFDDAIYVGIMKKFSHVLRPYDM